MTEETLARKIALASQEVGYLSADKRNKDQNYDYISADQVLQRAGDALAKYGVTIFPSITSTEVNVTERQGKTPRIDAQVIFLMVVTDGKDKIECGWTGYGSDYATPDKAVYKAITSGHKYFEMKLLNIGIGNEDGEHENIEKGASSLPIESQVPTSMKKANEIIAASEWNRFAELINTAKEAGVPNVPAYERSKMTASTLNGATKYLLQQIEKVGK